jgi:prepilin signal peptidase PulO-like enzyme (type II secretory pathway)
MIVLWLVLFFMVGAAVGSFMNVVADRLPEGKSITYPPSYCFGCKRQITAGDNIPIVSYLWLRGHCRSCGATIPQRIFWVELGTALLFAFLYWHYGLNWELLLAAMFCCIFALLLLIDLEHGILPNKIVYAGIAIALVAAGLGSVFSFEPSYVVGIGFRLWIINVAIGGAIGFVLLLLPALFYRGGMGWGDIKLAALIGFITGFPLVILSIFLAVIVGGLAAGILLILKIKRRKDAIPFGPFLSGAAIITLFWGNTIIAWLFHF